MMGRRSLHLFSILLLFLSTFVTAWPWPRWLPEIDTLVVRDQSTTSAAQTQSNTSPTTSQSNTQSGSQTQSSSSTKQQTSYSVETDVKTIVSGGHTFTTTEYQTITPAPATTTSGGSSGASSPTFDPSLPAGAITLITPAVISGPQYYKVGDNVTFVFGYTNVLATPTAVDVLATCTANQQMYTMALNHKVSNSTGTIIWDTEEYQATALADPLLTETYTLIIYDAASSISATAQAGYLAVYEQYTFGMYTPQPYTPLGQFQCATCSGAMSDMERMALTTALGMSMITILSFTWFVCGWGVIW